MKKILILYKLRNFNDISKLTETYMNNYENVDSYFVICNPNLDKNIEINGIIIQVKLKEDNRKSLLVKIIQSFYLFLDKNYTNIIVSNVSTFLNIQLLYNIINEECKCLSLKGKSYKFKNKRFDWPAGACYIFNISLVKEICNFFLENKYIIDNQLTNEFLNNYPIL
jgi:hypothetical protein